MDSIIQVILNLIFLIPLAIMDRKTHMVPVVVTGAYVLMSLLLTNFENAMAAVIVVIAMWSFCKASNMGTGDRKVIFGLVLQYGWLSFIVVFVVIVAYLYSHARLRGQSAVPLIPIILAGYLFYLSAVYAYASWFSLA